MPATPFEKLLKEVRACTLCAHALPHGVRPVLQASPSARILVVGQAPGRKVHDTGIPFNDPSGDLLRQWMGIDRDTFYDASRIAIIPMGFCYPGKRKSGDLPPRPECAPAWREKLLSQLPDIELTLVIGQYAQAWHLPDGGGSVTETVQRWREHWPTVLPLPHPSPRNRIWLRRNPWFDEEVVPALQKRVAEVLESRADYS
ncbi:MAG: uracil-DNA glycosylase family protein [Alcanivoracaceae bacterium]|nr:uracil-DNA glycosylase family protein [Alcanivoracaceae bacterium]